MTPCHRLMALHCLRKGGMSSATISLFASIAFATMGAAGLAFIMTHPGLLALATSRLLAEARKVQHNDVQVTKLPTPDRQKQDLVPSGTASIAASNYGHFETQADINGRTINVMVDTGATLVALTYDDAASLGIFVTPSDFTHQTQTANGVARVAPVTIARISIGDITVRNVRGIVSEQGKLAQTLLGMSFLGRLSRVEMRGRTLELQE